MVEGVAAVVDGASGGVDNVDAHGDGVVEGGRVLSVKLWGSGMLEKNIIVGFRLQTKNESHHLPTSSFSRDESPAHAECGVASATEIHRTKIRFNLQMNIGFVREMEKDHTNIYR